MEVKQLTFCLSQDIFNILSFLMMTIVILEACDELH